MEILEVGEKVSGSFKGAQMMSEHYDRVIEKSTKIVEKDGSFVAALVKNSVPSELIRDAWSGIRDYHPKTENRGTASGVKMVQRIKKDGTKSRTLRAPPGMEVESGVMGFLDRYPRLPYCRSCNFNKERPVGYEKVLKLSQAISLVHKEHDPVGWGVNAAQAAKTNPAFYLPNTCYTTVTINKNFRTYAHLDANNLKDGTCAMMLIKEGHFEGGLVVFPEYRVAVKMETGDILIFRNMKDFHGNTQIVGMSKNFQRCTLVHYFREKMVHCGTPEMEIERAKRRTAGDPIANDDLNSYAKEQ